MRVYIYKDGEGKKSYLIEPQAGTGLAPVLLRGDDAAKVREDFVAVIGQVYDAERPSTVPA